LLILDTDIASAFAKSGHFDVIMKLFESVGITPDVYEELLTPLEHGYEYPKEIFEHVELVTISDEEQREYLKFKEMGCTPVSIQLVKKQYLKLSMLSPPFLFPSPFPSRSLWESGTLWQNVASFCCIRLL